MVAGVPDSARTSGSFDGMQGSFFSSPSADEVILQIEFAKELADQPSSLIGKNLVVRYAERQVLAAAPGDPAGDPGISIVPKEKTLRIVGIIDTEAAAGPGGMGSGRVLIPQKMGEALRATQGNDVQNMLRTAGNKLNYTNLTVRAQSPSQVQAIEDAIKKMGFAAFSLLDATRNLRLFFAVFDLLLGIFGSLALAVAMLGIINTLVMAILERRREIGVLKALGAADRDVKQLFFVEAGVMGLFGGTLGVGLGWLIGRVITVVANIYLRRQDLPPTNVFAVPWWLVLGAIGFAVIVSLGAGLYPAARAAKLNPVEALRYE
jgi:putative ABC transport system permease protein